jgi:hypothetical protein
LAPVEVAETETVPIGSLAPAPDPGAPEPSSSPDASEDEASGEDPTLDDFQAWLDKLQ